MIDVCVEMKWTYYEYLAQPTWFVDGIIKVWQEQAAAAQKASRKK